MKKISIWSDYEVRNLSRHSEVDKIIEKLELNDECDVELDLCGCLIAYDATSRLIDKIVNHLIAMSGERSLTIKLTSISPEEYVLEDIFRGSECFKWDNIRENSDLLGSLTSEAKDMGMNLNICEKVKTNE